VIVIGTTVPPYVMDDDDTWSAWLYTAEAIAKTHDVRYFAAIETDARGIEHFEPLTTRLREVGGEWWEFRFDDGADEITTANRLRRITLGQNITTMYTEDLGASHLLFMAADCCPPDLTIPKLLEVNWPIVGGEVTTYGLHGEAVMSNPRTFEAYDFPVEEHMATAAFVMIERDLLKRVRWRYDLVAGMSDDPCLHYDALMLGYPTLVRKDVIGLHYPECIGPIEDRHADRIVRR
jgi:hypothetical protein